MDKTIRLNIGGINLSQCIPQMVQGKSGDTGKLAIFYPTFVYNMVRVLSYTAVGFVLGMAGFLIGGGTEVGLPVFFQGILKIIAGLFMVIMGINMLGLFPWLRKFTVRVPKYLGQHICDRRMRDLLRLSLWYRAVTVDLKKYYNQSAGT